MTEILRQKIVKLVRGDEGVALVVTLALFMFLYVSCAGVYTVGRAVKDRIILQNAVDAAAYSAAVVQADYLSRIATINKAMAWNYAQFIKCQKIWIARRFLLEIAGKNKDGDQKSVLKAYNRPLDSTEEGLDRINVAGSDDGYLSAVQVQDMLEDEKSSEIYNGYKEIIEDYLDRLKRQNKALRDLWDNETNEIEATAKQVLCANLPFRLGELCRVNVRTKDVLQYMDSKDDEEGFLKRSSGDDQVEDAIFGSPVWFEFVEGGDEGGFHREILPESLVAEKWVTSDTHDFKDPITRDRIDAESLASEMPGYKEISGFDVKPLKLNLPNYFPGYNHPSDGAITVAVAKWNENPWKQLMEDLTGIHAAFTHAEKNDWTIAIASAQAGYRNNTDSESREYSVNQKKDSSDEDNFDFVTFGKKEGGADQYNGQDWDAVYIPVRKAFAGSDEFKNWLAENSGDDKWEQLVADGKRKYVKEPLEQIHFDELNSKGLPLMHGRAALKWDSEGVHDFLDLMYH